MLPLKITQSTVIDLVPFGDAGSKQTFFALRLNPPDWDNWLPGQFIMLKPTSDSYENLWAKPFSLCQVTKRDLVVFFQVRDNLTAKLAKVGPGSDVTIWGPLGNSLYVKPNEPTLLLAENLGIIPFVGYAHSHPTPRKIELFFVHSGLLECYPYENIYERIGISTNFGSNHNKNNYLILLDKKIEEYSKINSTIIASGSREFLKIVQSLTTKHNTKAQLSLDGHMVCGIGACLGCVVKTNIKNQHDLEKLDVPNDSDYTYKPVCTCGPNFWSDNIIL